MTTGYETSHITLEVPSEHSPGLAAMYYQLAKAILTRAICRREPRLEELHTDHTVHQEGIR